MMAKISMVIPGPNKRNNIAGKIKNRRAYICLTDMAKDAGKSIQDDGLLTTIQEYAGSCSLQMGLAPKTCLQIVRGTPKTGEQIWALDPIAEDFGRYLGPAYYLSVLVLREKLRKEKSKKTPTPSLSFAAHMERDVQKTQSQWFNGWVEDTQGEEAISQANEEVLIAKTGRTSAE